MYYLDSSAWVKRYFNEPGSDRLHELFESIHQLASTLLGHVEVIATIARQGWARNINTEFTRSQLRHDWGSLMQLALDGNVMSRAELIARRFRLRGADAIHLSAFNHLGALFRDSDEHIVLLSSDQEMLAAATRLRFATEDPAIGLRG